MFLPVNGKMYSLPPIHTSQQSHRNYGMSNTHTDGSNPSTPEVKEGTITFERGRSGTVAKFKLDKRKETSPIRNNHAHEQVSELHATNPDRGLGVNAAKADVSIGQANGLLEALSSLHIGGAGVLNVANDAEEVDVQVRLKNAHIQMADGAVIEMDPSVTDIANRSKNVEASLERGPIKVKMEENSKLKISSKASVGNDVAENSKVSLKSEGLDITLKQQANVEISQTLNVANETTNANVDIEIGHQTLECEEGATAKLAGGMDGFTVAMEQLQPTLRNEGGAFKFETPNIINGELLVNEESQINITFAILAGNCSNVTYGDIDIFKTENTSTGIMNVPQCKRCCNCSNNLVQSKTICSCLHLPGLYSFSFIAQKTDSAVWLWKTVGIPDATIKINVTYRPSVTHLKIVGYETYIPRSTSSVTVVCSWVNGNPPTKARLMDRHNNVLEIVDKSGNVSYTFKSVTCNNAGVVRCEADGSDRNMSSTMLIECPPEFVRTPYTSYITKSVTVGQSAEFTFEFRSHSPNISSCHINHKHKPVDSDQFLTDLDNCTEAVMYGSTCSFNREHNHCQYCVTGKPPDLQLTLHVSDVKRNDDGNWTVTISNDKGCDVMDFHISINLGSVPADVQTKVIQVAVISGVTSITVIVVITVFCIIKGKSTYARLKRRQKQETVLHRGLGTDNGDNSQRLSGVYYEIQDTHLETDLQPKLPKLSVGVSDFPPQNYLHPVKSTSDIRLKSVDCLQIAQEETGSNAFAKKSECVKQIKFQNPASSSQNASDYLKPIPSESQTSNVVPMSDYLEPVKTESGIISKQKRSEYLKLDQTGDQTGSGQQSSDYLKLLQKDHDTNKEQQRSEYLEYLKLGKTGNQTDSGQQRP